MIKLILVGRQPHNESDSFRSLSFASTPYFVNVLKPYLQFEDFDSARSYSKNTVFVIMADTYLDPKTRHRFRNRPVIVDVCREALMADWDGVYHVLEPGHVIMYGNYSEQSLPNVIFVPNFFWYNESIENTIKGRTDYVPNRNYRHKFLMPIGRKTKWRDQVVDVLQPYLVDAYWSYVRRNKSLPGEPENVAGAKRYDQRRLNPIWYDDTCFSLVLESVTSWRGSIVPFLTEKIYKPMAYQHPFMVIGAPGILQYARSQGFETYENLFDEAYDQELDFDRKMKIIIRNIENFEKVTYNKLTLEKIQHNHDLFYNQVIVKKSMIESIVVPIEKYVNQL